MKTQPLNPHKMRIEIVAQIFPGVRHLPGSMAPRSVEQYCQLVCYYFTWCATTQDSPLDPDAFRAWRQHMIDTTHLAPATINMRLNAVKACVKASAKMGAIPHTLAADFHLVDRVKPASLRHRIKNRQHHRYRPEDIRAICNQPDPTTPIGLRDRALLHVLASSGCRISEAIGIQQAHIVPFGEGWGVHILEPKGEAESRLAPLSLEAHTWITRWLQQRDHYVRTPWVFTGNQGNAGRPTDKPMSRHTAWQRIHKYTF